MTPAADPTRDLRRFAWLSIAAAIATITLKAGAWLLTGSVGLLSDAAESIVNLVAAVVALVALTVAGRPADDSTADLGLVLDRGVVLRRGGRPTTTTTSGTPRRSTSRRPSRA